MTYRVAFAITGNPRDPAAYSGGPASVLSALGDCGVDVTVVNTEFARPLQRLVDNVLTVGFVDAGKFARRVAGGENVRLAFRAEKPKLLPSREATAIRSTVARVKLGRAAPVDRVIQFGSEYQLPPGADYVTLDDATIAQLYRSYPYHWMGSVSEAVLRTMIARQRRIFRRARACCVLNHWAARSAIEDYGVAPDRVHVVGAGSNRALTLGTRDWDTPRFLFVGKDFERKNGARVVEAFRRVRAQHPLATLDIVGQHPPLRGDGIHTHGELRLDRVEDAERLDALFLRATCFVMPSLVEPTGFVHAEALAAGIGSIGTTVGGVTTLIGDAGVTVPPLDLDALEAAMTTFCDSEVMREYGRRAAARAPRFTWRAVAERVIRALELPRGDATNLAEFL